MDTTDTLPAYDVTYSARVGLTRETETQTIHEFVMGRPDSTGRLSVGAEIRASWHVSGKAIVWVMLGSSSTLDEVMLDGPITLDDLTNLAVAIVARRAGMYHPLAEELGY